jgi:hypothetical protein
MVEKTYFLNGLPALYKYLKDSGRENEGRKLIGEFLNDTFNADIEEKINRFLETGIPPIPADLKYFPIFSELLQAYVNGLFYSTVMLAGTLCERICFDILSISKIRLNDKDLDEEQVAHLYEKDFSRLNKLLFSWGLIEKDSRDEMFAVYQKRISYVHPKMKNIDPKHESLVVLNKVTNVLVREFVMKRLGAANK